MASTNGCSPNGEAAGIGSADNIGEVCDRATRDELRAEGDTLLPELVGIFRTELTMGLDELARAIEARDCTAIARIAHTLKGTAGTFGARICMRWWPKSIKPHAPAGQADQAAVMFGEFRSECERVRRYLAAEIKA
jgi:hypothetical protein